VQELNALFTTIAYNTDCAKQGCSHWWIG
jgi:hypothetical protein